MVKDNLDSSSNNNKLPCTEQLLNPPHRKEWLHIGTRVTEVTSPCTGETFVGQLIPMKQYTEKYHLTRYQVVRRIGKGMLEGQFTKCRTWLVFDRPPDDMLES